MKNKRHTNNKVHYKTIFSLEDVMPANINSGMEEVYYEYAWFKLINYINDEMNATNRSLCKVLEEMDIKELSKKFDIILNNKCYLIEVNKILYRYLDIYLRNDLDPSKYSKMEFHIKTEEMFSHTSNSYFEHYLELRYY